MNRCNIRILQKHVQKCQPYDCQCFVWQRSHCRLTYDTTSHSFLFGQWHGLHYNNTQQRQHWPCVIVSWVCLQGRVATKLAWDDLNMVCYCCARHLYGTDELISQVVRWADQRSHCSPAADVRVVDGFTRDLRASYIIALKGSWCYFARHRGWMNASIIMR